MAICTWVWGQAVTEKTEDFWMGVAAGPVAIAIFAGGLILEGYVLSIVWSWFMVPFGLPQISIPWAIGVSVTASLVMPTPRGKQTNWETWFALLLKPLLILLIAWACKQWM